MVTVTINKCDVCGLEHRSDVARHWSEQMGPAHFSVKQVPGLQQELTFKTICFGCASAIYSAATTAMNNIKEPK